MTLDFDAFANGQGDNGSQQLPSGLADTPARRRRQRAIRILRTEIDSNT